MNYDEFVKLVGFCSIQYGHYIQSNLKEDYEVYLDTYRKICEIAVKLDFSILDIDKK